MTDDGKLIVLTAPLTETIDHAGYFIQMSMAAGELAAVAPDAPGDARPGGVVNVVSDFPETEAP